MLSDNAVHLPRFGAAFFRSCRACNSYLLFQAIEHARQCSLEQHMKSPRKRTHRGLHYRALAEGSKLMNSPVAGSFEAAAEHFDQSDPPLEAPDDPIVPNAKKEEHK
jgi:hypothetical protein